MLAMSRFDEQAQPQRGFCPEKWARGKRKKGLQSFGPMPLGC
jgi:hypothetical protein